MLNGQESQETELSLSSRRAEMNGFRHSSPFNSIGENPSANGYQRDIEESSAQRWHKLVSLLRRRRKVAALVFCSVMALAAVYIALAPRIYRAQADLLINSNKSAISQLGDQLPALSSALDSTGARSQETEVQIINSDSVRDIALNSLPATKRESASKKLIVSIRPIRLTDIISVYVSGRNPNEAIDYANAICYAYLKQNQTNSSAQYRGSAQFVGQQIKEVGLQLDKARLALRDYKSQQGITDLNSESEERVKLLSGLTAQYKEADSNGASAQAKLRELKQQVAQLAPNQIAEKTIGTSPVVQQLKKQLVELEAQRIETSQEFTPNSPELRDLNGQIQALQSRLSREANSEVNTYTEQPNPLRLQILQDISQTQALIWSNQARATALRRQINNAQSDLKVLPEREYRLSQLQSNLGTLQQIYQSLSEKYQTLRINQEAPMTNARVISKANSTELVSPILRSTLVLAFLLGTLGAIACAALIDRLDDRLYQSDDVQQATGLPILAQIPLAKENALLSRPNPSPILLESFRMLRTQLILGMPSSAHSTIAITSSQPHEGKSTVAANLAVALALNGKKVILLDADLRRPQIHTLFEKSNVVGFSSVVAGLASLEEALVDITDGLRLMPAGPMPPNPPELLDSQEARRIVETLKAQADVLIIDTPPAPMMADAQIVATMANGAIFVVSSKEARRGAVEHSINLLESTGVRLLGIVLNKQDMQNIGYYNSYQYKAYLTGGSEQN